MATVTNLPSVSAAVEIGFASFRETSQYGGRWLLRTVLVLRAAHGLGGASQPALLPHPLPVSSFQQPWPIPVHHYPHLPAAGRVAYDGYNYLA